MVSYQYGSWIVEKNAQQRFRDGQELFQCMKEAHTKSGTFLIHGGEKEPALYERWSLENESEKVGLINVLVDIFESAKCPVLIAGPLLIEMIRADVALRGRFPVISLTHDTAEEEISNSSRNSKSSRSINSDDEEHLPDSNGGQCVQQEVQSDDADSEKEEHIEYSLTQRLSELIFKESDDFRDRSRSAEEQHSVKPGPTLSFASTEGDECCE